MPATDSELKKPLGGNELLELLLINTIVPIMELATHVKLKTTGTINSCFSGFSTFQQLYRSNMMHCKNMLGVWQNSFTAHTKDALGLV